MSYVRPPMFAADHIRQLTQPFTTSEVVRQPLRDADGCWRTTPRVHHVTNEALLDQLEQTLTGTKMTAEGAFSVAYGSKPAGRIDVLAFLERLNSQSHDLAIELGFETPQRTRTPGQILPLRRRLSAISGALGEHPHAQVRSWWATARVLTQHDGPPYSPNVPCPVETCERPGALRVRIEERLAVCVECHTVWSDHLPDEAMSFGRLTVWIQWAAEHLAGLRHWRAEEEITDYPEELGYQVECPECAPERLARAKREAARLLQVRKRRAQAWLAS